MKTNIKYTPKKIASILFIVFTFICTNVFSQETPYHFLNVEFDNDWFNINNWRDDNGYQLTEVPNSGKEDIIIWDKVKLSKNIDIHSLTIRTKGNLDLNGKNMQVRHFVVNEGILIGNGGKLEYGSSLTSHSGVLSDLNHIQTDFMKRYNKGKQKSFASTINLKLAYFMIVFFLFIGGVIVVIKKRTAMKQSLTF